MKTIYLIGFMGSGKSSIGKELAKTLNASFIDIDHFIEEKYQQPIPEIFKEFGEHTFRLYEINALHETMSYDVVATGGGVVEREQNMDIMNKGKVIYLETSFEEINRRLKGDQSRPLWNQSKAEQKALYNKRCYLYEENSDLTIDTSDRKVKEIVAEIVSYINV